MLCLVAYYDITIYLYDNNLISSVARRASRALLFTFFLSVNYFFIFFFFIFFNRYIRLAVSNSPLVIIYNMYIVYYSIAYLISRTFSRHSLSLFVLLSASSSLSLSHSRFLFFFVVVFFLLFYVDSLVTATSFFCNYYFFAFFYTSNLLELFVPEEIMFTVADL